MQTVEPIKSSVAVANEPSEERKKPEPPGPVRTGSDSARDLTHLGRMARELLQEAKMPQHMWRETDAHELVLTVLGRYKLERYKVLQQRQQLKQLHIKLMMTRAELLGLKNQARAAIRKELSNLKRYLLAAKPPADS